MLALLENPTGLEAFVGKRARSGSLTCWEWESVFLSLRCTHPDGSESHPCPGQGCFSETKRPTSGVAQGYDGLRLQRGGDALIIPAPTAMQLKGCFTSLPKTRNTY